MSANSRRPYIGHVPREGAAPQRIADAINSTIDRIGTGTVTLTASATTTTLTDPHINYFSFIDLMPTTANAGAAKVSASFYIVVGDGSAVIHHASNAAVDQSFVYAVVNG